MLLVSRPLLALLVLIISSLLLLLIVVPEVVKAVDTDTENNNNNNLRGGIYNDDEDLLEYETRIIGGTDVSYDSSNDDNEDYNFRYPYYVLLFGSHVCGGVLIAPLLVITAAHCNDATNIARIGASRYIGSNNGEDNTDVERIEIEDKVIHPDFGLGGFRFSNDIMILKLSQPSTKQYARLFNSNSNLPPLQDNQDLIVLGMGQIIDTATDITDSSNNNPTFEDLFPSKLQSTTVQYVNHEICKNQHIFGNIITDDMICAHDFIDGSGPCNGDSGGPLIISGDDDDDPQDDIIVGLVSWGRGCASIDKPPTVYVSIHYFYDWIVQTSCELLTSPTSSDVLPSDFNNNCLGGHDERQQPSQQPSIQPSTQSLEPTTTTSTTIPSSTEDNLEFVTWSRQQQLGHCQGNCYTDSQCSLMNDGDDQEQDQEPMVCYRLNSMSIPGCIGLDMMRSVNYCVYLKDI